MKKKYLLFTALGIVLLLLSAYFGYSIYSNSTDYKNLVEENRRLKAAQPTVSPTKQSVSNKDFYTSDYPVLMNKDPAYSYPNTPRTGVPGYMTPKQRSVMNPTDSPK